MRGEIQKTNKKASTAPCSVAKHLGSGRAVCISCFPLHFFRALPLPACFTTEQSTVEASLFVKYIMALMESNRYYKIAKPSNYQAIFKDRFIVLTASVVWVTQFFVWLLAVFAFAFNAHPKPDLEYAY